MDLVVHLCQSLCDSLDFLKRCNLGGATVAEDVSQLVGCGRVAGSRSTELIHLSHCLRAGNSFRELLGHEKIVRFSLWPGLQWLPCSERPRLGTAWSTRRRHQTSSGKLGASKRVVFFRSLACSGGVVAMQSPWLGASSTSRGSRRGSSLGLGVGSVCVRRVWAPLSSLGKEVLQPTSNGPLVDLVPGRQGAGHAARVHGRHGNVHRRSVFHHWQVQLWNCCRSSLARFEPNLGVIGIEVFAPLHNLEVLLSGPRLATQQPRRRRAIVWLVRAWRVPRQLRALNLEELLGLVLLLLLELPRELGKLACRAVRG
mmetsp:Transcript_33955/g.77580  ORF Transcript_33955/g.77580 Transcript_33955/m.77580 type:complete len:313 (+) Transcript_33955:991-1929(+)